MNITAKGKGGRYTPIEGKHNKEGGGAMIFDTFRPTGNTDLGWGKCSGDDGDPDLGAPNELCDISGHKPGEGDGGEPDSKWGHPNCERLGNVLVIQESDKACPDDAGDGGWLTFEFPHPTEVSFAKLLDVDEKNNRPRFHIYYANETYELSGKVDATGDNGVIDWPLSAKDVVKVSLEFWGSGSIADLNYRYCPTCPEEVEISVIKTVTSTGNCKDGVQKYIGYAGESVDYCYNVTNEGQEPLCKVNVTDPDIGFEKINYIDEAVFVDNCLPPGKRFQLSTPINIPSDGQHSFVEVEGGLFYSGCPDSNDRDDAKLLPVKQKQCPLSP